MRSRNGRNMLRALILYFAFALGVVGPAFAAGTLTELQALIDAKATGETLALADDYAFVPADFAVVSNDGVRISKAIAIDGNGHTVSGAGSTRVLLVDGVTGNTALTIKNLTITQGGNIASGSAIFIAEGNRASFANCVVTKNGTVSGTHTADGGSIFIDSKAIVAFTDCTISNNLGADRAAGIYLKGNATLENCKITDNVGGSRGGGLYVDPGYQSPKRGGDWGGNVVMKNCTISGNSGGRGAGLYINSENDKLNVFENCVITGNKTSRSPGNGGGILFYYANARMTNCTISDNQADKGAGVIVDVQTNVTLENCTISDNKATGTYGGGLLCHDGSYPADTMKPAGNVTLSKSTIKGNVASGDAKDDIYIHWSQNDDKSPDVSLGPWVARYDGNIASGGGNTIGTLINPKNFTKATSDKVDTTKTDLPAGHPDASVTPPSSGGGGSGGCATGFGQAGLLGLLGALFAPLRRRRG